MDITFSPEFRSSQIIISKTDYIDDIDIQRQ